MKPADPDKGFPDSANRGLLRFLLILATLACYANALRTPFMLDDPISTIDDARIQSPWRSIAQNFQPPETTITGRPVVALTFAINYLVGGRDPLGYHIINILLHIACALLVAAIAEWALSSAAVPEYLHARCTGLAYVLTLVFATHPVQTESITYIVQRTELMWSLFFLVTLYCCIRAWDNRSGLWTVAAGVACWLGAGCKENMVVAPVLVLLYDWAFVSLRLRKSLREHWRQHTVVFSGWLPLAWIVLHGARHSTAGWGLSVSSMDYLRTQMGVILGYVRLVIWPTHLVAARFLTPVGSWVQCWPQALAVMGMAVGSLLLFLRRPAAGFLALWTLIILAPTSSVVPIVSEMAADRRMYMPMIGVIWYPIWGAYRLFLDPKVKPFTLVWIRYAESGLVLATVLALGSLSYCRNRDYRSERTLWADIAAKQPESVAAVFGYAKALVDDGDTDAGIDQFERALALSPEHYMTLLHYGQALKKKERISDAVALLRRAVLANPNYAESQYWLGRVLAQAGNHEEAILHLREAIRLNPELVGAFIDLGAVYSMIGETIKAVDLLQKAVALDPRNADVHFNLGALCRAAGRSDDARAEFEKAVELDPSDADAHFQLAELLGQLGQVEAARHHFEIARRLNASPTLMEHP
ncbi:MAG: tetratricopeptide repeat protein [Planctomycetes bacterium]|nr:tetratricopeptide repeat protein [Planctomycetota bacterium]MBI3833958.1 tetratricopeptide repeat protein [Planctomycetota bacterium]